MIRSPRISALRSVMIVVTARSCRPQYAAPYSPGTSHTDPPSPRSSSRYPLPTGRSTRYLLRILCRDNCQPVPGWTAQHTIRFQRYSDNETLVRRAIEARLQTSNQRSSRRGKCRSYYPFTIWTPFLVRACFAPCTVRKLNFWHPSTQLLSTVIASSINGQSP